ncbi:MAG: hypothetical protein IPL61_25635 [Myxococcales bacterium]|nr:hypothetical protein [Myxococcales bacterium]
MGSAACRNAQAGRAERDPQDLAGVGRDLEELRERGHRARELGPRRLQRERALEVVLRDRLVAEVGVGERAAPERGGAVGLEADGAVERARGLGGARQAQERVAEALPGEVVLGEQHRGALVALGRAGEVALLKECVAFPRQTIGRHQAHVGGT